MAKNFDYGSGLEFAWNTLWKNPKILVPYAIAIILGSILNFIFMPGYMESITNLSSASNISNIVTAAGTYIILAFLINLILKSWAYFGVAKLVKNKRFELNSFMEGISYVPRYFALSLLILIISAAVIAVLALIVFIAFKLTPILGVLLGIVGVLAFIIFYIPFIAYILPFMFVGDNGVFETVENCYRFVRKNLGHAISMFLITAAIIIVLGIIVQLPIQMMIPQGPEAIEFIKSPTYSLIIIIPSSFMSLGELIIRLFYFHAYTKKVR